MAHPAAPVLSGGVGAALFGLFLAGEAVSLGLAALSAADRDRRFLLKWALTLPLYFPLAAVAAYKGLWEVVTRPFWWDKTEHGRGGEDQPTARTAARRRASGGKPGLAAVPPARSPAADQVAPPLPGEAASARALVARSLSSLRPSRYRS